MKRIFRMQYLLQSESTVRIKINDRAEATTDFCNNEKCKCIKVEPKRQRTFKQQSPHVAQIADSHIDALNYLQWFNSMRTAQLSKTLR